MSQFLYEMRGLTLKCGWYHNTPREKDKQGRKTSTYFFHCNNFFCMEFTRRDTDPSTNPSRWSPQTAENRYGQHTPQTHTHTHITHDERTPKITATRKKHQPSMAGDGCSHTPEDVGCYRHWTARFFASTPTRSTEPGSCDKHVLNLQKELASCTTTSWFTCMGQKCWTSKFEALRRKKKRFQILQRTRDRFCLRRTGTGCFLPDCQNSQRCFSLFAQSLDCAKPTNMAVLRGSRLNLLHLALDNTI